MTEFTETIHAFRLMRKPAPTKPLQPHESWRMHELAHVMSGDADHGEHFYSALRSLSTVEMADGAAVPSLRR
jgi:hypothetical protein